MTLSELNNLSFDNIGSWPLPVKIVFIILICAAILGVAYWKDVSPLQDSLAKVQEEEQNLRVTFEAKQKKAANLEALKQQLEDELKKKATATITTMVTATAMKTMPKKKPMRKPMLSAACMK